MIHTFATTSIHTFETTSVNLVLLFIPCFIIYVSCTNFGGDNTNGSNKEEYAFLLFQGSIQLIASFLFIFRHEVSEFAYIVNLFAIVSCIIILIEKIRCRLPIFYFFMLTSLITHVVMCLML